MAAPNPQQALDAIMSQALRRRQDQLSSLRAEIAETEEMLMTALSAPSSENSAAIVASCQSKLTTNGGA